MKDNSVFNLTLRLTGNPQRKRRRGGSPIHFGKDLRLILSKGYCSGFPKVAVVYWGLFSPRLSKTESLPRTKDSPLEGLGNQPTLTLRYELPRREQGVTVNWKLEKHETCNYRKSLSYVGIDYYKLCLNAKTLRITLIIQKFILCEKLNYDFRPKCRFFHFCLYILICRVNKGVDIQVKKLQRMGNQSDL